MVGRALGLVSGALRLSAAPPLPGCRPSVEGSGPSCISKEGEVQGIEIIETKLGFRVHPWVPVYPRQERVSTMH